jgi:hypothetical protein
MSRHLLFLLLLAMPCVLWAQTPSAPPAAPPAAPYNPPTLAVLLANRPAHIEEAKWLAMMLDPVNRSLYPLRISQATLDTLDGRLLDLRFQYIMVR